MQELDFTVDENLPLGQLVQDWDPIVEYCPAIQSLQEEETAVDAVPARHTEQLFAPENDAKNPAEQFEQYENDWSEYVPGLHKVHELDPTPLTVPCGHVLHWPVPFTSAYFPVVQAEQSEEPVVPLVENPRGHKLQVVERDVEENLPLGHLLQGCEVFTKNSPALQSIHEDAGLLE
jgi:hypothetical protein